MELTKVLDRIRTIDSPNHLMSVNATTLLDTSTGRYITSSTKGLKRVYSTIGMFDNVFVDKLRKLDQSYCEKQINDHFKKVSDEYKFFEIDNTLRVMENNKYDALKKLLDDVSSMYENAESTFSGDMLYIDSNLGNQVSNKYLTYNFINSKFEVSSYVVIDNADSVDTREFYGIRDYQVRLDDPGMIPSIGTYDVVNYVNGSQDKVLKWDDVAKVCKNLKSRDTTITLALLDATSEHPDSDLSSYTLSAISQLIYRAYIESPQKMMRYIDQFNYAMANLYNPVEKKVVDTDYSPDNIIVVNETSEMVHRV